jgi:hypothetical protein
MITKYVDNKELKRIVDEGNLKLYKVKSVLKKRGVLLTSTSSNIVAEQMYPILWGILDMSEFKDSIDDSNNYIKSSLIEINCKSENEIIDTVESAFTMSNYMKKQYSFDSMCRDNNNLSMRLKYPKSKIGKNELMSIQDKYVDIFVKKISENKAIFDIRQASSNEMKDVNKFLNEVLIENNELKMRRINLGNLTNENRIDFFDKLNLHNFKEWTFLTVTKMELKKNEANDDEEVTLDEDESNEQALGNLRGITSAIVNGTSIRTNSFVQECLKNQFSIATMGYKYQHKTELVKVIIEINFKYDDIKIDISKTYEYDDTEKKEKAHPLMLSRQEDIIKSFQDVAYNIYEEIISNQK